MGEKKALAMQCLVGQVCPRVEMVLGEGKKMFPLIPWSSSQQPPTLLRCPISLKYRNRIIGRRKNKIY
jgi:hypothetical protein